MNISIRKFHHWQPVTNRWDFPDQPGLYAVKVGWKIVYIGVSTTSIQQRWYSHEKFERAKRKRARVGFCINPGASPDYLRTAEKVLILKHKPRWNYIQNPNRKKRHFGPWQLGRSSIEWWLFCVTILGIVALAI